MVCFKIVKGNYKGKKSIYNTIRYVLNPNKNPHNIFHAYGNTPEDIKKTADSFYKVQIAYNKTSCKRIIHCILAFSPDTKYSPDEFLNYGYRTMEFFEKGTQYVFALHEKGENGERKWPHIHILINPINAKTGERLSLDKAALYSLRAHIQSIFKDYTEFEYFPEEYV